MTRERKRELLATAAMLAFLIGVFLLHWFSVEVGCHEFCRENNRDGGAPIRHSEHEDHEDDHRNGLDRYCRCWEDVKR